jgi:hypothetical protein
MRKQQEPREGQQMGVSQQENSDGSPESQELNSYFKVSQLGTVRLTSELVGSDCANYMKHREDPEISCQPVINTIKKKCKSALSYSSLEEQDVQLYKKSVPDFKPFLIVSRDYNIFHLINITVRSN